MSLQYISDSDGVTTGVFIPINEWNTFKEKFKTITQNEDIPQWQIKETNRRIEMIKNDPSLLIDAEEALKDIEKEFGDNV